MKWLPYSGEQYLLSDTLTLSMQIFEESGYTGQAWLEIWLQSLFKAVAVKPVWIGHCPWSSQNTSNGIAFPLAQVAFESLKINVFV